MMYWKKNRVIKAQTEINALKFYVVLSMTAVKNSFNSKENLKDTKKHKRS